MQILFIGDIVAEPGRKTVKKILPEVLKKYKPDLVIANGENITHGDGFSPEHIEEMRKLGINFFTTGNHVWSHKDGVGKLSDPNFPIIRPANYPSKYTPGRGYAIIEDKLKRKILVINLLGLVFMGRNLDSPFKMADTILNETSRENLSGIIIDFHAEATSEKYALGFYLDGKVSAIIGTHTHVQTADERIFENGTAYISDVGMVGAYDSVIGVKKDLMVNHFFTQLPVKHEPEDKGKMVFGALFIELDEKSKKALNVERILKIQ